MPQQKKGLGSGRMRSINSNAEERRRTKEGKDVSAGHGDCRSADDGKRTASSTDDDTMPAPDDDDDDKDVANDDDDHRIDENGRGKMIAKGGCTITEGWRCHKCDSINDAV